MNEERWSRAFNAFKDISKEDLRFFNVLKLEELNKGIRILDVGCGRGSLVKLLYERGFSNVVGIDKTSFLFDKEIADKLYVADAIHIPFPDDTFDLVLVHGVLHHLSSIDQAGLCFKEIKRVLTGGGMFYLCEPINTIWTRFALFFLLTPLSNIFEYSKQTRILVEEELPELTYWLKNSKKVINIINQQFITTSFHKDFVRMYVKCENNLK